MARENKKIAATPTFISPLYGRVSEKSNAVRAELPLFRMSGSNSETVSRNFGALVGELDIFHAVRGKSGQPDILRTKGLHDE